MFRTATFDGLFSFSSAPTSLKIEDSGRLDEDTHTYHFKMCRTHSMCIHWGISGEFSRIHGSVGNLVWLQKVKPRTPVPPNCCWKEHKIIKLWSELTQQLTVEVGIENTEDEFWKVDFLWSAGHVRYGLKDLLNHSLTLPEPSKLTKNWAINDLRKLFSQVCSFFKR